MIKKYQILNSENPLEVTDILMDVPRKTKIYCKESYLREMYDMYMGSSLSYKEPVDGSVITGKVVQMGENSIHFDIGAKQTAISHLKKETSRNVENIKLGDDVPVKIRISTKDGSIDASITDAHDVAKVQDIMDSIGKEVAYLAKVKELIYGGYYLDIDGINVFMPGSLAGMNKLWDFDSLIGKEINVMSINYERNLIIVSHRAYLERLLPSKVEEIKGNLSKLYDGNVTGCNKTGVFVEFETCVTGFIPASDLIMENQTRFNNGQIKPGNPISVYIKEIINDKKIILSQDLINPWLNIEEKYKVKQKVFGKILKVRSFGSFIELEPGITTMLHSSEYKEGSLVEGEVVGVFIYKIDIDNKKIIIKSKI
jgi:ribosomal protein S1